MPGFDWNANGQSDAFDHFMEMKVVSDSTDTDESSSQDETTSSIHTTANKATQSPSSSQESNISIIGKSFLVIIICIIAFAIAVNAGGLVAAAVLLDAAFGGYFILKK